MDTHLVNYDVVAPDYDRRYERYSYDGVRTTLSRFVEGASGAIAEVGCGTGHWLMELSGRESRLIGLDLSLQMLQKAHAVAPSAALVRGSAGQLPWVDGCIDRVFCVNALHHFPDPQAFVRECRRVLGSRGGVLTIGLDPHRGDDRWWIYDFFPAALDEDRVRYASTETIRDWLLLAGFREAFTEVAEHIRLEIPFDTARKQGFLDRHATSQFMVIGDDDFEAGMQRLMTEQPVLRADLRLHATIAWT